MTELTGRTAFNCPVEGPVFREYRSGDNHRARADFCERRVINDDDAIDTAADERQM